MKLAASRLTSFRLPILSLWIAVSVLGCSMSASSGVPETPVSLALPTLTLTPTETFTPEPTATETIEDLDALDAEAEEVTATPEFGLTEVAQFDVTEDFPPVDEFDAGPLPTNSDPVIQAATDIVATVTQESIDATATVDRVFLVTPATNTPDFIIPSLTPTPDFASGIATQQPIVSGGQCTHLVRAGDNLFRLSLQYNVPIRDIAVASGVANPDLIIVGQTLTIPNCAGGSVSPGIPGGSTGGGAGGITHVVEQGETLYQLSVRYNVPIRSIAATNGIQNVNLIYFNQRLTIP